MKQKENQEIIQEVETQLEEETQAEEEIQLEEDLQIDNHLQKKKCMMQSVKDVESHVKFHSNQQEKKEYPVNHALSQRDKKEKENLLDERVNHETIEEMIQEVKGVGVSQLSIIDGQLIIGVIQILEIDTQALADEEDNNS